MSAALEVNECLVNATAHGSDWWTWYRHQMRDTTRLTIIQATLGGDVVSVACEDREHALWLRALAIGAGIPRSALKVRVRHDQRGD